MPERSPLMSARNTGTPCAASCSAMSWRVLVLPVPVAPATRPCRLSISSGTRTWTSGSGAPSSSRAPSSSAGPVKAYPLRTASTWAPALLVVSVIAAPALCPGPGVLREPNGGPAPPPEVGVDCRRAAVAGPVTRSGAPGPGGAAQVRRGTGRRGHADLAVGERGLRRGRPGDGHPVGAAAAPARLSQQARDRERARVGDGGAVRR